jgi:uncharacterized protein (TIGR02996 family)
MYNKEYETALKYALELDNFVPSKVVNINDDLPHLVHADYLEENNKPLTSKFIREVTEGRTSDPDNHNITQKSWESNAETPTSLSSSLNILKTKSKNKLDVHVTHSGNANGKLYTVKYTKSLPSKEAYELYHNLRRELK